MNLKNLKKTKATGGNQVANEKHNNLNPTPIPKKWQRVLSAFLDGRTFNRFEAERQLNDHALHSTVSSLQAKGVTVLREFETVPGYQGIPTHVCRYWLEQSEPNLRRASFLLGRSDTEKAVA